MPPVRRTVNEERPNPFFIKRRGTTKEQREEAEKKQQEELRYQDVESRAGLPQPTHEKKKNGGRKSRKVKGKGKRTTRRH